MNVSVLQLLENKVHCTLSWKQIRDFCTLKKRPTEITISEWSYKGPFSSSLNLAVLIA